MGVNRADQKPEEQLRRETNRKPPESRKRSESPNVGGDDDHIRDGHSGQLEGRREENFQLPRGRVHTGWAGWGDR